MARCRAGDGRASTGRLADVTASDHLAFGFRVRGLGSEGLNPGHRADWPQLRVRLRAGNSKRAAGAAGEDGVRLPLGDSDWLELDRTARTATYRTHAALDRDRLLHPLLAPAAAVMARWLGREAFHAGAFLADGGAWALAGTNEAGKSSLLAALAMADRPVLTDDLLVVGDGLAYAGPRCVDLRELHVVGGSVADRVRSVRGGTRHRLDLPPTAAVAPLRGWFFLEWGDAVEAVPCAAGERIGRIMTQRRWATEAIDPHVLLELGSLPAWVLRRPRGAQHMAAVLDLLASVPARGADVRRDAQRAPAAA